MRVVIDANLIIERDWYLTGSAAHALLAASSRGRVQLVVPEVVVREVVAAHGERVHAAASKARSAESALRRLVGPLEIESSERTAPPEEPFMRRTYDSVLRDRLKDHGVEITPIPEASGALVERALKRRRPFDSKGHAGFRDALIWQTVLDGASAARATVFATDNTRDFVNEEKTSLHEHLVEDITDKGLKATSVQWLQSMEDVARTVLEQAQDVLDHIKQRIHTDDEWGNELFERMRQDADAEMLSIDDQGVTDIDVESAAEPFADSVNDWVLEDLEITGPATVTEAFPLTGDVYAVQLEVAGEAVYQVEISTDSFWNKPGHVPTDLNLSRDERSAYFHGSAAVQVLFDGRYDTSTDRLTDLSVIGLVN